VAKEWTGRWRERLADLRWEIRALRLACRDSRVPWPPKLIAAGAVAYALSPIDLIPDFLPVIGGLDDLIIVPAGLALAARMIPSALLAEHRAVAARERALRVPPADGEGG